MVLGAVEDLVAGLALLRTEGRLTLVGSGMEVQLVVMLGGAEDIARFAPWQRWTVFCMRAEAASGMRRMGRLGT